MQPFAAAPSGLGVLTASALAVVLDEVAGHLYHALPGSFGARAGGRRGHLLPWCVHRIRRLRGFRDGPVVQRSAKGRHGAQCPVSTAR